MAAYQTLVVLNCTLKDMYVVNLLPIFYWVESCVLIIVLH